MTPSAESIVHIDDARFRVTEWRFAPGAETGWHVHDHDYVIVPVTDGDMGLQEPGGVTRTARLTQHVPYSRRTGVEHNVINAGTAPMAFLEIEAVAPHEAARRAAQTAICAALEAQDAEAVLAALAPDCELRTPGGTGPEALAAMLAAWPPGAMDAVQHLLDGDAGASFWRLGGTVEGGHRMRFDGAAVVALDIFHRPV